VNEYPDKDLYILIRATVTLSALGIIAIMFVNYIRPMSDNFTLDTMILGFLAPTILAFMAFLKTSQTGRSVDNLTISNAENKQAINELKTSTDGMKDKLVQSAVDNATLVERASGERTATAVAAALVAAAAVNASTHQNLIPPPHQ
jgi:hypothetical protein